MNIPSIVASNPADGPDVCGPLIRELLRLENSFNMKVAFFILLNEPLIL
jgi:hypothetical protein